MKLERGITVARDLLCLLLGVGGIIYQQVTGNVHWELLLVYMGILGVPGAMALISLISGSGSGPTTESSPQRQDRSQQQRSPSQSSRSSEGQQSE